MKYQETTNSRKRKDDQGLTLSFNVISRAYDSPGSTESVLENEPDAGKSWYVEGFASTQDIDLTRYADADIQPAGLRLSESALNDLVAWTKELPTVFKNHNLDEEIGRVIEAEVREGKMWVKILITKTRPDIWQKILEGVLCKFSVQFIPRAWHFEQDTLVGKPVQVIDEAVGLETSVVGLPMNYKADAMNAYAASFMAGFNRNSSGVQMDRTSLIEQIKAFASQLSDPTVDTEIAGEIRNQIGDLWKALAAEDASIPNPLAAESVDAWYAEVIKTAPAAGLSTEPEAPVVAAPEATTASAPVSTETGNVSPSAQALLEAVTGTTPVETNLSPEVSGEVIALRADVKKLLSTVARGNIPLAAVADMAYLEDSLEFTELPEKSKAKAKQLLTDMFRVVCDGASEKKSADPAGLGAVARSFEQKASDILGRFNAALEASKQENLAAQAVARKIEEMSASLEKKMAELQKLTVSGPNGPGATPPAAPVAIDMSKEEDRKTLWMRAMKGA